MAAKNSDGLRNAKSRRHRIANMVYEELAQAIEWHMNTTDWSAWNDEYMTADEMKQALRQKKSAFQARAHDQWNKHKQEEYR